ncbi:MAG: helix-turn-helix domain-containing protein [Bacteroidota bacterium]
MPRSSPFSIQLAAEERSSIESMARHYTSPYYSVIRAKIVLMAADGLANNEIAERLDLPRQIVSKWRKRFFEQRLDGLDDLARAGRPRGFSPSGGRADQGPGV